MRRLSLKTRGFILVGFPLLCQLIFICALSVVLWQMQDELRRRTDSRDLIAEAIRLDQQILDLTASFRLPDSESGELRINKVNAIAANMRNFLEMAKKPNRSQDIETLQTAGKQLSLLFEVWRAGSLNIREINSAVARQVKISAQALTNIIDDEEKSFSGSARPMAGLRTKIENLFFLAAVGTAACAVGLGYVFALLIRNPIRRLSVNVKLLSEKKKLEPESDTGDEFGALDKVLHNVASLLERASADAQNLLDNAQSLICSLKGDGSFTNANRYSKVMLGIDPEQLIGKRLVEIAVVSEGASVVNEFEAAKKSSKDHLFELKLNKSDGSLIDTRWSSFWSTTDKSLFSVVNDITEQKKVEQLKQDFAEMIRQELYAPLSLMNSSLSELTKSVTGDDSDQRGRRLQSMSQNVERLIALVNALLESQKFNSSRMQLTLEYCDLKTLIEEAIAMVQSLAESKRVKLTHTVENCSVMCDTQKIREVVINLLANAIKFTPPRSTVQVNLEEQLNDVSVRVTDQGPGVPEEASERIFLAFEQTSQARDSRQGVGLGLAICKLIIEAHAGTIGVVSGAKERNFSGNKDESAAVGSTFWFRIPKDSATTNTAKAAV